MRNSLRGSSKRGRSTQRMSRRVTGSLRFPPQLKTALDGKAITPRADPPTVVQQPWNTVTLTFNANFGPSDRTITLTSGNINNALISVYPSEAQAPYQFQIKSARLWEVQGHSLACAFHSLDKSNPGFLKNIDDSPARNQWARVGYIWPRSHQNQILINDDTTILTVTGTIGALVTLHIDILWKPIITLMPPPSEASNFTYQTPSANRLLDGVQTRSGIIPACLDTYPSSLTDTPSTSTGGHNFESSYIPGCFPDSTS